MRKIELIEDESPKNNQATPGNVQNLEILKAKLSSQMRHSNDAEKIERALNCFTQSPVPESDVPINDNQEHCPSWCESFIYAGILVTAASYLIGASGVCDGINSKFCGGSRVIPAALGDYFSNPDNVNIDQTK
jgi:hypothetical protein